MEESELVDWNTLPEKIRRLMRSISGLQVDEDYFQGLIDAKDSRERTRLGLHNIYRHNYLMLLNSAGGEEWEVCGKIADGEQHLFISEDGERATAFILAKKKEEQPVPVTNITMQNQPPQELEKKKGWLHR